MKHKAGTLLVILLLLRPVLLLSSQKSNDDAGGTVIVDSVMLKALKARSIGPAIMSGRVSDIAYDPADPFTFYVCFGTGGLMKTSNDGATLDPVFEKEAVASVGAIAVSPTNPKIIWVGTGEANDRNSSSWGNGVYRSGDGGGTWTHTGLKDSKVIARIAVQAKDTNTVYVAVVGDLWTPSAERGLYKTTDGGKSWKQILKASSYSDRVGCGDVVLDPSDTNTVYAALYARQRTPWSFTSGADLTDSKDVGGIFKSTDAGNTWKKLENGLPHCTQRIGLAIYQKNSRILYAIVQSDEGGTSDIDDVKSKTGGVFRSEDGGETWTRMNPLDPRPFYFSQIRVDPTDDKKVYVLGYMLHFSDDGGKTFFEDRFGKVHSDCHALAFDPKNPKHILLGTDGGVYQSFNYGKGWDFLNSVAEGEYYRITVDSSSPYRIAGGLQDNTNWLGPSRTRSKEGILNGDWTEIGGGDGFYCVFDPEDSNVIYAESQEGYIHRLNLRTGEFKRLRPEPEEGQQAFRFHWNSPLVGSMHDKGVMYLSGNRVFRLTDHGEKWKAISPDLSAQDPKKIMTVGSGAENYGVVYTLAESPLEAGLLWAGTDDGKLWITENDGATWSDLTKNLPDATKGQWISRIEAGHHDPKVAYLAVDAHRSGNYSPLAYRTSDGGKSWRGIAGDLPVNCPVKVVREDIQNPNVLFAGTEFHLFTSLDGGIHWVMLGVLPTVAVDDLVIQPRERDLIVATHGRSIFIVDDIRPLEELTAEAQSKEAYLFTIRPAFGIYPYEGWVESSGNCVYRGANPPEGAIISFYVRKYTAEPAKIAITDTAGHPVANLTVPCGPGINRTSWDLKMTKDLLNDYGGEGQKFVKSGDYTVSLSYGKTTQKQIVHVEIAKGIETR